MLDAVVKRTTANERTFSRNFVVNFWTIFFCKFGSDSFVMYGTIQMCFV